MHASLSVGTRPLHYEEPIIHGASRTSTVITSIFAALGALCLVAGVLFDAVVLFVPGLVMLFAAAVTAFLVHVRSDSSFSHCHDYDPDPFIVHTHHLHSRPQTVFVGSPSVGLSSGYGYSSRGYAASMPLGVPSRSVGVAMSGSRPGSEVLGGTRSGNPLRGGRF